MWRERVQNTHKSSANGELERMRGDGAVDDSKNTGRYPVLRKGCRERVPERQQRPRLLYEPIRIPKNPTDFK